MNTAAVTTSRRSSNFADVAATSAPAPRERSAYDTEPQARATPKFTRNPCEIAAMPTEFTMGCTTWISATSRP
jgi:hypothetical protein